MFRSLIILLDSKDPPLSRNVGDQSLVLETTWEILHAHSIRIEP